MQNIKLFTRCCCFKRKRVLCIEKVERLGVGTQRQAFETGGENADIIVAGFSWFKITPVIIMIARAFIVVGGRNGFLIIQIRFD